MTTEIGESSNSKEGSGGENRDTPIPQESLVTKPQEGTHEESYVPVSLARSRLTSYLTRLTTHHSSLVSDLSGTYQAINEETVVYFEGFCNALRKRADERVRAAVEAARKAARENARVVDEMAGVKVALAKERESREEGLRGWRKEREELEEEVKKALESGTKEGKSIAKHESEKVIAEKDDAIAKLEKEKEGLEKEKEGLEKENSTLKADLDALKAENAKISEELEDLRAAGPVVVKSSDSPESAAVAESASSGNKPAKPGKPGKPGQGGGADPVALQRAEADAKALRERVAKLEKEIEDNLQLAAAAAEEEEEEGEEETPADDTGASIEEEIAQIESELAAKRTELETAESTKADQTKEKKRLKKVIYKWTQEFEKKEGRAPKKDDRGDVQAQYDEYKAIDKALTKSEHGIEALGKEVTALEEKRDKANAKKSGGGAAKEGGSKPKKKGGKSGGGAAMNAALAKAKLDLHEAEKKLAAQEESARKDIADLRSEIESLKASGGGNDGDATAAAPAAGGSKMTSEEEAALRAEIDDLKKQVAAGGGGGGGDATTSAAAAAAAAPAGDQSDEIESLREQLELANESAVAERESLENLLEEAKRTHEEALDEKRKEIDSLREQVTKLQTEGLTDETAKETITDLQAKITALNAEKDELRAEIAEKNEEIEEVKASGGIVFLDGDDGEGAATGGGDGGDSAETAAELEELRTKVDELEASLSKVEAERDAAVASAATAEAACAAAISASIDKEIDHAKSDLATAEKKHKEATKKGEQKAIAKYEKNITSAKEKLETLEKEKADPSAAGAAAGSSSSSSSPSSSPSSAAVDAMKKRNEELVAQVETLKKDLKESKAKGKAGKGGKKGADSDATKDKQLALMRRQNQQLATQLKQARASGGSAGKGSSGGGSGAGGDAQKQISRLEKESNKKDIEIRKATDKITRLEDKVKQLEEKKKEAAAAGNASKEASKLEKQLENAKEKHEAELAKKAKEKEDALAALEKKKDKEMEKIKKDLEAATASSGTEIEKLKSDLETEKTGHADVKEKLAAAEKELESLNAELEANRAELVKLGEAASSAAELQAKLDETQKEFDELTSSNAKLQESFLKEAAIRKKYHNIIEDMKGAIRVFARTRPISKSEKERGSQSVVDFPDEYTVKIETAKGPKEFTFDAAIRGDARQVDVFEDVRMLVQSAVDGYNVCIFAYGQTGSGKTFTMAGEGGDLEGITPRAMRELYRLGDQMKKQGSSYKVSAYMLELYNDKLIDLLYKPKKKNEARPALKIKKDAKGMVFVQGAVVREASNPEELQGLMDEGATRRHTSATQMNAVSSRSHLIFAMIFEAVVKGSKNKIIGKMSLVDLAGSERVKKTGASAERLHEAQSINKSLSALGDVISALSSGEGFIPYRNSALTLLLSDGLGGNAKTLMFVCYSPVAYNVQETEMALAYAQRVKMIKNNASKNVDTKEVQKLRKIIAELRAGNKDAGEEEDDVELTVDQKAFEEQLLSVHDTSLANKTVGYAKEEYEKKVAAGEPVDED